MAEIYVRMGPHQRKFTLFATGLKIASFAESRMVVEPQNAGLLIILFYQSPPKSPPSKPPASKSPKPPSLKSNVVSNESKEESK